MDCTFRLASAADLNEILVIIRQAKAQMMRENKHQWDEHYPARIHIVNDIHSHQGYVLCQQGKTIAYCAMVFSGEPVYDTIDGKWLSSGPYVVLHRLAVADAMKHKGVATGLMKRVEVLAKVKGVPSFRIDTSEDNNYMQKIFHQLGFSYCGKIQYVQGSRMAFEKML
ncbi:MAG: GNAT family N-acetyltransferase [Prevotella sp.]|jgi:N-acetylglutamate synthase-like GNAT family acetyltransferase|nr:MULTISPECIES: GNAT family N-acetyltransferase [unclassified Prevotella]MCH3969242.1 GNAT family N-acetyltransferase [Prevotella sp.]MCH3985416.1 GNAT family N-acetyltransferase [Prevotella sp.]MCH3991909.1 GNAT family N-acetyltransferase [Prevotella sp.]MCH4017523.1 GNAT family N-acetyltransferase [Prevotella sp.]MCH4185276.1 GNAT family N-acetyltransferase [Prevotella sp.]